MDISGVSVNGAVNAALAQKEAFTQEQVSISLLKKSLDTQMQSANSLIEALPNVTNNQNLPENLGKNINTTA